MSDKHIERVQERAPEIPPERRPRKEKREASYYYMWLIGDKWLHLLQALIAEFVAIGLLVYVGTGAAVISATLVPGGEMTPARVVLISLAFGFVVALLVYTIAWISGAHFNPAITLAVMATNSMPFVKGLLYIGVQIAGAIAGSALLKASVPGPLEGQLGANDVVFGVDSGEAFLLEFILTFLLVWTVFATAINTPTNKAVGLNGHMAPLAIGLAVLVAHLVATPFTGTSVNPARSLGPAIVQNEFHDFWVFMVGPFTGGLLAGILYQFVFFGIDGFKRKWSLKPKENEHNNNKVNSAS